MDRPTKISFGDMRESGVRGLLIYCADYRCNHSIAISGDAWPDDLRLTDLEPRFICQACSKRGADVRPDTAMVSLIVSNSLFVHRRKVPIDLIKKNRSRTGTRRRRR